MTSNSIRAGDSGHRVAQRAGAFLLAGVLVSTAVVLTPETARAAHTPDIPMGSLTDFSVLASTMITDTGGTSRFSDGVGVSPGVTITGIDPSDLDSGGIHINDSEAQQAQLDLLAAYAAAAAPPATAIAAELGTTILTEGVYQPGAAALGLTGTLILNGNGDPSSVFVIRTDGAFDTAAASAVTLSNGAQECNVYWLVAGAVTLGANSDFSGTILAQGAVTVGNAVNFHGRAFTRAGAVTLSANRFFEPTCAGVSVTPATGLVTTEAGGAATFTVVLNAQPTLSVTIGLSSSDPTEGTVSTPTLTFTTLNWNTPQTVTVTGVDDSLDDGDIPYTVTLAPAVGGDYAGIDPADVAATNTDNDATPATTVAPIRMTGLVDTSAACPASIAASGFADVGTLDAMTVKAIDCIFHYGISNGTSDVEFTPSDPVARWQMALFLIRQVGVHGVALPVPVDQGFTDVLAYDLETRDAINQLAQFGITKGTGPNTFAPGDSISRWEMALFLVRFLAVIGVPVPDGVPPTAFTDMGSFGVETTAAVDQLVEQGVAAGTSPTTFDPTDDVLRWQMALFLTRVLAVDGVLPS